jgi:CBS domain-containing protein
VSRDQTIPITISIGIAEYADTMPTAEGFLELARSALRMSKEAGRNRCTYLHSGDAEAILLDRPAATCDVLNRTVARDVMAACIVLVEELETVGRAAEYLRRSRLLQAPVVNAAGECVGVVNTAELERIANQKDTANWPVRDVMNNDVIFQEESATLKSLFELFRRGSADEIVIVHDAKPTGMVTRGGLAMLSEPISEETFRATGAGCGSSADMIVPELEVLAES